MLFQKWAVLSGGDRLGGGGGGGRGVIYDEIFKLSADIKKPS